MGALPEEQIRAALEELLSWPGIARSPQLARFLNYIVEATLKGEDGSIKAYAIAVDVFGRPPSFDPQSDPIVRVQARRLRALLDQFYDEGRGVTGIRINLPVGRYVPEFLPIGAEPPPNRVESPAADGESGQSVGDAPAPVADGPVVSAPPRRLQMGLATLLATAIVAVAAVATVAFYVPARQQSPPPVELPEFPQVVVGSFSNVSGLSELDDLGARIADRLEASLEPFEDLRVSRSTGEPRPSGTYLVSGAINPAPLGIELAVVLNGAGDETLWSHSFTRSLPDARGPDAAAVIARVIASELAPYRGPLHAEGRTWLDAQPRPLRGVNPYVCLLTYRLARETGSSTHIADSIACNEKLLRDTPDLASALSTMAWLETRAEVNRALPDTGLFDALNTPLKKAERAVALLPDSSLVHEHLGMVRNWQENFDQSAQELVRALELNPLNTDARALYAVVLSRSIQWPLGAEQAALAIADTPYPSPWYYYPVATNEFRENNFAAAIDAGSKAARFGSGEVGTIIALAAAGLSANSTVVEELRPRLLGMENLRRAGVMVWLGGQIKDPAVMGRIAEGLTQAGVPPEALTAAF